MAKDKPKTEAEESLDDAPRRLSRGMLIGAGGLGAAVVFGLLFFLTHDPTPEPEVLFEDAFSLLDRGDVRRAGNVGRYLRENEFRDLHFGGGVEFILGVSEFELGSHYSVDAHTSRQHYETAVEQLEAAFEAGLILERRPRWTYSIGLTLYRLNRRAEAEQHLVEALSEYPEGRYDLALALCDCDLCPTVRSPQRIARVISLSDEILADSSAGPEVQTEAWFFRAEGVLAESGHQAASDWIARSTKPASVESDHRLRVLNARIANLAGNANDALSELRAVVAGSSTPPEVARAAAFEMGKIYEATGDDESAIAAYRMVIEEYDEGDESVVAAISLGDLLRREPRTLYEDALRVYKRSVQINAQPEFYRNRYTTLEHLRQRIRDAWEEWLGKGEHLWAIKLATEMAPLYRQADAAEMAAVATLSLAQNLTNRWEQATAAERERLLPDVLAGWRRSGVAFARLADARISDAGYADALWTSAEHFTQGHDFQAALEQIELFLQTGTESRRPRALVNYGRLLMDLHQPGDEQLDKAVNALLQMLADYPTSDASFDCRFALGECYLERDEPDLAAVQWQQILDSDVLSPASLVWQQSLVAVGSLYFHTGELLAMQARKAADAGQTEEAMLARQKADFRWSIATQQLETYLARTPVTAETATAKFWLAKSLQRSIELPKSQLDSAETNNARQELERQISTTLTLAINHFRDLKDLLEPLSTDDLLTDVQKRVLRDSCFEIAHTYFLLGDSAGAIDAYSEATNRYPNDPQVLLAYVQSARCFERMGRDSDARSQLERARIIQEQLAESEIDNSLTSFSHDEWATWLTRTIELMNKSKIATGT